jgi:hypothetical protein
MFFNASDAPGVQGGATRHRTALARQPARGGIVAATGALGMSVATNIAVIHTLLGFTSLTHAFKANPGAS